MRRYIVAIIVNFVVLTTNGQGIVFDQRLNWQEIKDKAKKENKFVFVDLFATWCVPCREMDARVYNSDSLTLLFNDHYVSVKLQMDSTKSDNIYRKSWYKDAQIFRDSYAVSIYPTLLIFSPSGDLVDKVIGYKDAKQVLKIATDALDSTKQFYTELKKYKKGEMPYSEMRDFVKAAKSKNEDSIAYNAAGYYIENYLLGLPDSVLFRNENLDFIGKYLGKKNSKSFDFFLKNRQRINKILGDNQSEYNLRYAIDRNYLPQGATWKKNTPNWDSLQNVIYRDFGLLGQEVVFGRMMIYYLTIKDYPNFGKYYKLYFELALKRPEFNINEISWLVFQRVTSSEILRFASEEVMTYAIEEWYQNDPASYDTYANLLYKHGKVKQAILWEEKAVKIKRGAPDEHLYTEALRKMISGDPTWNEFQ